MTDRNNLTNPVTIQLHCECGRGLKLIYDASVPTKLVSFECSCGRSTPIRSVAVEPTPPRADEETLWECGSCLTMNALCDPACKVCTRDRPL